MRSDRLLELAGYLDGLWPDVFDMTVWAESRGCGTVCCALGHAATIFAAEGLRLKWDGLDPVPGDAALVVYAIPGEVTRYWTSYRAAVEFFEIAPGDAIHLFCPHGYRDDGPDGGEPRLEPHDITPYEVADRIRVFVAEREPAGKVVSR